MNRILVTRTDKLGDVILITPVLSALRKKFSDSFISVLVKPYTKEILEDNPDIDEIIVDDFEDGLAGTRNLAGLLKTKKFDIAVVLFPTWRVSLSTYLAKIPLRLGSGYRLYSFLFNKRIFVHRKTAEKHEVEYNFDIVKPLGVEVFNEKCKIHINKNDLDFADGFYRKKGLLDARVVVVHPGSGGSALNWPIENYAKLADLLFTREKVKILITAGENELDIAKEMAKKMSNKPEILDKKITIKQLTAIISKCSLFISSSTGPMHIAASVGVPTLSFFCPIHVCKPVRWGPWMNKNVSLVPDALDCKTCSLIKCKYYNCMDKITVAEAFASAKKLLE